MSGIVLWCCRMSPVLPLSGHVAETRNITAARSVPVKVREFG